MSKTQHMMQEAINTATREGRALDAFDLYMPAMPSVPDPAPEAPAIPATPISAVTDLGTVIRDRRKAMDLTQQEFADLTGVGRRFISELEAGKQTLEFGRVLKVCQSVGLDLIVASR